MEGVYTKPLLRQRKNRTRRPFVLAAVMLAMFMGAIEATIVSTAMPDIVADLGGFSLYSWVFSAYLLMNSVTVLIYGKLSDLFGRKPILIFGIVVFLIGSILCGLANSMKMLIIYRLIQGFGAGAVTPIATTIVGDIYTTEERAKVQGYLASVWGVSAIMGPALGGFLVQFVSWRYVFWINIPLGLLAIAGLWFFLHETIEKKKRQIDYVGAALLTVVISTLMIVLVQGGTNWGWLSPQTISLLFVSLIAFVIFIWQEKHFTEPVMPLSIWKERLILIANVASLITGIMLIGISSFLPTFVQGVMEQSPMVAGFTLTTMSIGWPIASTISGRMMAKYGYRGTSIIGGILLIVGSGMFVMLTPQLGPIWAAFGSFFFGFGMGLTSTAFIVSIQSSVRWEQRGIATASNMFMRNLGNTVGAALLGGILNSQLYRHIKNQEETKDYSIDSINLLLNETERHELTSAVKHILQEGLTLSLHTVYYVVLFMSIFSFILMFLIPKQKS